MVSLILGVLAIETIFRIWKPPFLRLVGTQILLPKNATFENNYEFNSDKLQNHITIKRNSLGFRGPEPPINFSSLKTIIAVGGSTTECIFLTEGKTWADVVYNILKPKMPSLWINNAGIDGHSTFGHLELMKQYISKLKPTYALFLVGINDMAIEQGRDQDNNQIANKKIIDSSNFFSFIKNNSMLISYLEYLFGQKGTHDVLAMKDWIADYDLIKSDPTFEPFTDQDMEENKLRLAEYKNRLESLMKLTQSYSIKPILITQPTVYGYGIDKTTGIDLGKVVVSDFTENGKRRTGADKWRLLETYNDVTRNTAKEFNIPLIDLAREMPKDTNYYYDFVHFTEKGAEKVGEIMAEHLSSML